MSFHVGQKVVFVGGRNGPNIALAASSCRRRKVYTVRALDPTYLPYFGVCGVAVEEIVNQPVLWMGRLIEPVHRADMFRPVIERKTDTGFAILEEIRRRETVPAQPKQRALTSTQRQPQGE